MARDDRLTDFVAEALAAGRARNEIEDALGAAGWSDREIADGLSAFADTPFTPPVPAPVPVVSARDFFTYALIFISLGAAAWHLVELALHLIDQMFDPAKDWRMRRINWSIAALAVFGPIYFYLARDAAARLRADPQRHRSAVRRWTEALILLLTVLALLGTLVATVYAFLEGEADLQFILKAAVAAAVAGGIFLVYRRGDG
ncbi:MAG: DUF5671 domain-containing protein [Paracoccaceae bacterium]|nr:DUF5671 domain-containing protein [Paracoccaceae bacterium]